MSLKTFTAVVDTLTGRRYSSVLHLFYAHFSFRTYRIQCYILYKPIVKSSRASIMNKLTEKLYGSS